jgi:hypothetical protein
VAVRAVCAERLSETTSSLAGKNREFRAFWAPCWEGAPSKASKSQQVRGAIPGISNRESPDREEGTSTREQGTRSACSSPCPSLRANLHHVFFCVFTRS